MIKYTISVILLALILIASNTEAQIKLDFDASTFHLDDAKSICEIYYSFPDNSVKYSLVANGFRAVVLMKLLILKENKVIDSIKWEQPVFSIKPIEVYTSDFTGIYNFNIPIGKYKLILTATDSSNQMNNITKKLDINVRKIRQTKIDISDIQLSVAIESERNKSADWSDSFKKKGLFVIPNPKAEIMANKEPLNSYAEIYRLDKFEKKGVKIRYQLFDATNSEVFKYERDKKPQGDSFVDIISIPLEAIGGGVYFYRITVMSKDFDDDSVSSTKKIYILNSDIKPQELTPFLESYSFERSEFSTMGPEKVETTFQQIKWLTDDYEKDIFERCTATSAKQRFLFAFWKKRNPDTTAFYNKALEDFRQRIDYANDKYKIGLLKEGWKTDRGRVLIKYKYPTTIDRIPQKAEQPAYEIWHYDEIQGGVQFVFIDFSNNGSYLQVHSTATGEVINDTWKDQYIEQKTRKSSGGY
jgi:GWxTD domain-containing protein